MKQHEETTQSEKTPASQHHDTNAFDAKAARLSNIPTTEDVRRAQEAQMSKTQRALLSYILPTPDETEEVVEAEVEKEPEPNKLPPRTVRPSKYGAIRDA